MKYTVTVEVREVRYRREYDSNAGPKEVLERIGDAIEAEPAGRVPGHGLSGYTLSLRGGQQPG